MTQRPTSANPMWGGQYAIGPAEIMEQINVSIDFDKRLYAQDIVGSLAHCQMLVAKGILTADEGKAISDGLQKIKAEIDGGQFVFKRELEDIHMNVEARLAELIGDTAGKLHTARSRNDQVATDFRLYVRDAIDGTEALLKDLQKALITRAEEYAATIMPGFTHMQSAQPVTLGHHLMAYVEMFGRDRKRFQAARENLNESPLGAAALAGTSFPTDRHMTAKSLGFNGPMANSLDAVSDRDFALEFLSAASICSVHLSRLAEELILWSSPAFSFIRLSDAYTTGSSIMPQKRNPDAAELVRGKAGRIFGHLQSLLVMMKALPLAYNKDMQEDKQPVFAAHDEIRLCLAAMTGMIGDFKANSETMKHAAAQGFSTATDLADWLVRALKLPFRKAHHLTAQIVKIATDKNCGLEQLALKDVQAVEKGITQEALDLLTVEQSVASRQSFGGTSPARVKEAITEARKKHGL